MRQKWVAWLVARLAFLRVLLPTRYLKILDWYIIRKFIGTYVFSILLTSGRQEELSSSRRYKTLGALLLSIVGCGVVGAIFWLHGFGDKILSAPSEADTPSMTQIGESMLSGGKGGYLLPFEAVSVLLLACIVAGLLIARKR